MESIGCPASLEEMGLDPSLLPMTLKASKDIRDKYILSRLLWDLGILDAYADSMIER
jgi:glycerol-1-phosphate dehydrogenase [NAD(P)+]